MTIPEQTASMIRAASIHTGLSVETITGPLRTSEATEARWACYVAMREAGMTLASIGAAFKRGHDTVIHGLNQAERDHGNRTNSFRQLCGAVRNHAALTAPIRGINQSHQQTEQK